PIYRQILPLVLQSVGTPHRARPPDYLSDDGEASQAVHAERIQVTVLAVRQPDRVASSCSQFRDVQDSLDARWSFPHAPSGIRGRDPPRDGSARHGFYGPAVVQRVAHRYAREVYRRVLVGREWE